jgi:hypothetical protein
MLPTLPASLDSRTLARRLGELAANEREVQVEFLLHLAEFDARRAWAELGYGSLWEYCLRVLRLREGAAGRRIGAMRVLRRLPRLEPALACAVHNALHAEHIFGAAHIAQFRRTATRVGESAIAGDS